MSLEDDRRFMARALRLAARAEGRTRPNPMVGALIVKAGRVVGKGYHHRAGEPHAEVLALREAKNRAKGATAYVTLEPCCHFGRTPPCSQALIDAGVSRVVVAMEDPNPKVAGGGLAALRRAGIQTLVGILKKEAEALNLPFLTWIRDQRPAITLKTAASLDGKIATHTGESQWITGSAARRMVQRLRARHDAVMVGIGTVLIDNPRLNCRTISLHEERTETSSGRSRNPIRVIVDSQLRTPPDAQLFQVAFDAPIWIATAGALPEKERLFKEQLPRKRPEVSFIHCQKNDQGRVDLEDLMKKLGAREITSLLSEAGGKLTASLLEKKLVEKLALFLAPRLIGGRDAAGIFDGFGISELHKSPWLKDMQIRPIGRDWLIEGNFCSE
ncbi:bifunctional diaminohydroxyphosphoribosylaminopyrimidine deaminase/5-amino-6-(5-phosphoribosylamino)uracil reductase RibD [Magnetococcales bacterium HHB-1]